MDGTVFGRSKDLVYMDVALKVARKALDLGEVPVGAVVVDPRGEIVAQEHNMVEAQFCQTGHAELRAIEYATRKAKNWRLDWHWLYVTLEPCLMCLGCIQLSRFAGVVYGAPALEGQELDIKQASWLYNKNNFVIISQVKAGDSIDLLQEFFQCKRK